MLRLHLSNESSEIICPGIENRFSRFCVERALRPRIGPLSRQFAPPTPAPSYPFPTPKPAKQIHFQVTETLDARKYFLDIDKIERYPITFVIKSEESVDKLRKKLEQGALRQYSIAAMVVCPFLAGGSR